MLYEPTTLASIARLIGETLQEDYGIDPEPIFEQVHIDTGKFATPGSRIPRSKMFRLWDTATFVTGDQQFGMKLGARTEPADLYVLGCTIMASETLKGAMDRISRYAHVLATAAEEIEVREEDGMVVYVETFRDRELHFNRVGAEASIVVFFKFLGMIRRKPVRPLKAELVFPVETARHYLDEFLQCPVTYGAEHEKFYFPRELCEERLPGYMPDILDAATRIAEQYLESLDQSKVATDVRRLLVQMLPSGNADQDTIASRLYRSTSTLQRQLSAEGTSYRDILDTTRRDLAEKYLRDGDYTQAEVAYMVGFSDQSNFARAFKRWTGVSPGQFQKTA
jgi:AraC-like DNA-binding protein